MPGVAGWMGSSQVRAAVLPDCDWAAAGELERRPGCDTAAETDGSSVKRARSGD